MNQRDKLDRLALRAFGYDPDDPVPRGWDGQRIIPVRLLEDLAAGVVVSDASLDAGRRQARTVNNPLSRKERAVLACLSHGLSYEATAARLGKSVWTVKNQSRSARALLGAQTTTQACCEAIRRGLID